MSTFRHSWHYILLWLLVLISLAANAFLIYTLFDFQRRAKEEVAIATALLSQVEIDGFDLNVQIDETLPISITVPFSDTFSVPISSTVPVSTSIPFEDTFVVPVNTVIPINTQVAVPVPILGNIPIPIPIVTSIPISLTIEVPISRTIPVQIDIPVELMVDVPVQSEIPVQSTVPVELDFPVAIMPGDIDLNAVFDQVAEALAGLVDLFGMNPVETLIPGGE